MNLYDILYNAACKGDYVTFKRYFEMFAVEPNASYMDGDQTRTFLMVVLENDTLRGREASGHIQIARFLLDKGADFTIKSYDTIFGDKFYSPLDVCELQAQYEKNKNLPCTGLMNRLYAFFQPAPSFCYGKNVMPLIREAHQEIQANILPV